MSFQVPFSSSPPSTPDRQSKNGSKRFRFGASNPSTTPAGPPPSSAGSYTPSGPPPSSFFGSSGLDSQYGDQPIQSLKLLKQPVFNPSKQPLRNSHAVPADGSYTQRSGLSNEYKGSFAVPDDLSEDEDNTENMAKFDQDMQIDEVDDVEKAADKYFGGGDYSLNDIDRMVDDMRDDEFSDEDRDVMQFNSSVPRPQINGNRFGRSQVELLMGIGSLSRSRQDDMMDFRRSIENPKAQPPKDSMYGRVAKDIYTRAGAPRVNEDDSIILGTEEYIIRLYKEGIGASEDPEALHQSLATTSEDLTKLWNEYCIRDQQYITKDYKSAIGMGLRGDKYGNATFLASLLLPLHHAGNMPSTANDSQNLRGSMMRDSVAPRLQSKPRPVPAALLKWMDENHDPYVQQLDSVTLHRPNPANHRLFWETIMNCLVRGRILTVLRILEAASWRHARTDLDNGSGYTGVALANVEKVIHEVVQILQQCPGRKGDWETKSSDWTLFRLRASQALENLKRFAEGRDRDQGTSKIFQAQNFGLSTMSTGGQSYTGLAKRAESQVPWKIYQHLVTMYNIMLGDTSAIIGNGQDWLEATAGCLIWWNPGSEDRHLSLRRTRLDAEDTESEMYLAKLAECFYAVTAESTDFQVNTINPLEVGLACIFESDNEAIIGLLRSMSGPISAAVAEIASIGGWLRPAEPQSLIAMESLDQDDMDVLGLTTLAEKLEDVKDYTLIVYAEGLATRGEIVSVTGHGNSKVVREGWELSIEILGRLDSAQSSEEEVGLILKDLPLDSSTTLDKLWRLLNGVGMLNHAQNTAEKYADQLAAETHRYGEALWYYALAHKSTKVKDVLDLLLSFSLIHSTAFPPESDLDDHLQRLISSPRSALADLAKMDFEAGNLLYKMLSGYATLRKFYDLRDAEVNLAAGEEVMKDAFTRSEEASSALITVITSSDDNIRGGLYDENRGAVVSVDFLLTLLGEAMVFVNQPDSSITPSQIDMLLKAIEDLQTVSSRVYGACDEFFQTVIASTQGMNGSTPMDLLKKSTSSLSGTSSFSLAGSSMLASQLQRSMGSSGVMVKADVKRGWDWRRGLPAGVEGKDILQILRNGLAKDLARVWLMDADRK